MSIENGVWGYGTHYNELSGGSFEGLRAHLFWDGRPVCGAPGGEAIRPSEKKRRCDRCETLVAETADADRRTIAGDPEGAGGR